MALDSKSLSSYWVSVIVANLLDSHVSVPDKCTRIATYLNTLSQEDEAHFSTTVSALLPSLLNLLSQSPKSAERDSLTAIIDQVRASRSIQRYYELLAGNNAIASQLASQQKAIEEAWSIQRQSSQLLDIDAVGAARSDKKDALAKIVARFVRLPAPEQQAHDLSTLTILLMELRRMICACELQCSPSTQSGWDTSNLTPSPANANAGFQGISPKANSNGAVPICFDSEILSQLSLEHKLAISLLVAFVGPLASTSSSSMDIDPHSSSSPTITSDSGHSSTLPLDVQKLVLALVQAPGGDTSSFLLLLNTYLLDHRRANSPNSDATSAQTTLQRTIQSLIEYLHLLRSRDPSRAITPVSQPIGPFSPGNSATHPTPTTLAEAVLGSGFPRRLSLFPSTLPQSDPSKSAEQQYYHIPNSRTQDALAISPQQVFCTDSEDAVAVRVESLLRLICNSMLSGPQELMARSELAEVANKMEIALASFHLLPELQAQLVFGKLQTSKPVTNRDLVWIREMALPANALRRLEWRRFLASDSDITAGLLNKISNFALASDHQASLISGKPAGTDVVESTIKHFKRSLEFLCLAVSCFKICTSYTILESLKSATSVLLALGKTNMTKELGEALELLVCALALMTPNLTHSTNDLSLEFALLSSLISQLSSTETYEVASPALSLFTLVQELHMLGKLELLARVLQHALQHAPVDIVWLVRGLQTKFQANAPNECSPIGEATLQKKEKGDAQGRARTISVCLADAWSWTTSLALLSHTTLITLLSNSTRPSNGTSTLKWTHSSSLVHLFDASDLSWFSTTAQKTASGSPFVKNLLSTQQLNDLPPSMESTPKGEKKDEEKARWSASTDPWLPWIIMRLLLSANRFADFQRSGTTSKLMGETAPVGGNLDGVSIVLWNLLHRLSEYICLPLPKSTYAVHPVVFDTLAHFTELCLEGDQRFWSMDKLSAVFSPSLAPDFTHCLLLPSADGNSIPGDTAHISVCHLEPPNFLQVLLFTCLVFSRVPSSKLVTHIITPSAAPGLGATIEGEAPAEESFDESSLKKSEFIASLARFNNSSSVSVFSVHAPSQERKRTIAHHLRSALLENYGFSPSKLLVLSKLLWVDLLISLESKTSHRTSFSMKGLKPIRLGVPLFDIIRKRAIQQFPHVRLFSDLIGLKSEKQVQRMGPKHTVPVDFSFLGGDYRSLVANHPFLSNVPFASLHDLTHLDQFLVSSIRTALSSRGTLWNEKRLVLLIGWCSTFVCLERTLAACAHAILLDNAEINNSSISLAIDQTHEELKHTPQRLFNFDFKLLALPTLFNYLFFHLVSFYYCLSKTDISALIRSAENKDDHADHETEAESAATPSTTTSTSPSSATEETSESPTPVVSVLTDPFLLRAIPKHRPNKSYGNTLGEKKMTAEDAQMLIRLQDSALVQILIDLMQYVEDMLDEKGERMEQGVKEELRVAICQYLQQLFVNDAPLMTLVHHQGYPTRVLPFLVNGVPAMHYCLELAPSLLAAAFQRAGTSSTDQDVQAACFPVKMAAWTIKRFPTQRSLDVSTYIFDLYRAAGHSLNPLLWAETLPDLARLVLTFPSLLAVFIDLVLIHEGSSVSTSTSSSATAISTLDNREGSLERLANAAPLNAKDVLKQVFTQLIQGEHLAPFLRV